MATVIQRKPIDFSGPMQTIMQFAALKDQRETSEKQRELADIQIKQLKIKLNDYMSAEAKEARRLARTAEQTGNSVTIAEANQKLAAIKAYKKLPESEQNDLLLAKGRSNLQELKTKKFETQLASLELKAARDAIANKYVDKGIDIIRSSSISPSLQIKAMDQLRAGNEKGMHDTLREGYANQVNTAMLEGLSEREKATMLYVKGVPDMGYLGGIPSGDNVNPNMKGVAGKLADEVFSVVERGPLTAKGRESLINNAVDENTQFVLRQAGEDLTALKGIKKGWVTDSNKVYLWDDVKDRPDFNVTEAFHKGWFARISSQDAPEVYRRMYNDIRSRASQIVEKSGPRDGRNIRMTQLLSEDTKDSPEIFNVLREAIDERLNYQAAASREPASREPAAREPTAREPASRESSAREPATEHSSDVKYYQDNSGELDFSRDLRRARMGPGGITKDMIEYAYKHPNLDIIGQWHSLTAKQKESYIKAMRRDKTLGK